MEDEERGAEISFFVARLLRGPLKYQILISNFGLRQDGRTEGINVLWTFIVLKN